MRKLTNVEIMKVVHAYIGVGNGYLGDFSYQTHSEFYPIYCGLDINPYDYPGPTRERFKAILSSVSPVEQAAIIRGVVKRFPLGAKFAPETRTPELMDELLVWAMELEATGLVEPPERQPDAASVWAALEDARAITASGEAPRAVDRMHTALHAYLRHLCAERGLPGSAKAGLAELWDKLQEYDPAFAGTGPRQSDVASILSAIGTIVAAMNAIRNHASPAHPNKDMLGQPEARLYINVANTILDYVSQKISAGPTAGLPFD